MSDSDSLISLGRRWDPERLDDLPEVTQRVGTLDPQPSTHLTALHHTAEQRHGPEQGLSKPPFPYL